jgi:hypothetical protein
VWDDILELLSTHMLIKHGWTAHLMPLLPLYLSASTMVHLRSRWSRFIGVIFEPQLPYCFWFHLTAGN